MLIISNIFCFCLFRVYKLFWDGRCYINIFYLIVDLEFVFCFCFSQAWVDTVWDLDFTEAEPLDSRVEEGITEDGLDAFTQLYKTLYPFAAEDHGTTEVRHKLSTSLPISTEVPAVYFCCSTFSCLSAVTLIDVFDLKMSSLCFVQASKSQYVWHIKMFLRELIHIKNLNIRGKDRMITVGNLNASC